MPANPSRPASDASRTRPDRCPGVVRPWPAQDGALVRVRLVGGRVTADQLRALLAVARRHGDGRLHLTSRANLQLRGLPLDGTDLPAEVVAEVERTGLLPSRTHELARNIMVSPLTGLAGGRTDLRGVAADLDRLLCATPELAALPGRFLFVLDDGRGDLVDLDGLVRRGPDLGLVALDDGEAQLRHGRQGWGEIVPLPAAASALVALAARFCAARGTGPHAPWHVDELGAEPGAELAAGRRRDPRTRVASPALPHGGAHVHVPDGVLTATLAERLADRGDDLVVTPWHGVLVADEVARGVADHPPDGASDGTTTGTSQVLPDRTSDRTSDESAGRSGDRDHPHPTTQESA